MKMISLSLSLSLSLPQCNNIQIKIWEKQKMQNFKFYHESKFMNVTWIQNKEPVFPFLLGSVHFSNSWVSLTKMCPVYDSTYAP